MLTSVAGPMSNFLLGTISLIIYYAVATIALYSGQNEFLVLLLQIFSMFYSANMILGLFNLLPIPPLDGYKVFGALLPRKLYFQVMRYERYIGLVFLFLIFSAGVF